MSSLQFGCRRYRLDVVVVAAVLDNKLRLTLKCNANRANLARLFIVSALQCLN